MDDFSVFHKRPLKRYIKRGGAVSTFVWDFIGKSFIKCIKADIYKNLILRYQ